MSRRLRIVHVLGAMDYGGVESVALRLMRTMDPDQFEHAVISTAVSAGPRQQEFAGLSGAAFSECPYEPGRRGEFVLRMRRALQALEPDRVLAYSLGNHAMVALAARLAGIRQVYVRVAGSPLRDFATRWKSAVLAQVARPFCRGEIAVSREVARQLVTGLGLPAHRVHTIPNGCDVEQIRRRASAARASVRDRRGLLLLMISRMDDAKDQETLLRASSLLLRSGKANRVQLAGDGPKRPYLEAVAKALQVAGSVEFLGNRTDIPELLGRCDMLVHSTHTEGFPNVLIEAMAAETPVLASDLPVTREVLENGDCGLLAPGRDPYALANAIVRVAQDATLRRNLLRRATDRVERLYDVQQMARRYASLLQGSEPEAEVDLSPAAFEVRR